jgi:predicted MPP superfamily phosphohydrolase
MGCCNSKEAAPLDPAAFPAGASSKDEISASGGGEGPAPFSSEMLKSEGTWRNEDEAETLRLSSGDDDMERSLHIIHFNDIHNFDPLLKDNYETAAKFVTHLKSVVATVKAKYRVEPLIVFSGDFIGPSRMSTLTKGAHMVELLNLCGVHFATFGRHDFYYGYPSLKNRLNGIDDISSESASKRNMSRKGTGVKQRLSNSGLEDDKMNVRTETKVRMDHVTRSLLGRDHFSF